MFVDDSIAVAVWTSGSVGSRRVRSASFLREDGRWRLHIEPTGVDCKRAIRRGFVYALRLTSPVRFDARVLVDGLEPLGERMRRMRGVGHQPFDGFESHQLFLWGLGDGASQITVEVEPTGLIARALPVGLVVDRGSTEVARAEQTIDLTSQSTFRLPLSRDQRAQGATRWSVDSRILLTWQEVSSSTASATFAIPVGEGASNPGPIELGSATCLLGEAEAVCTYAAARSRAELDALEVGLDYQILRCPIVEAFDSNRASCNVVEQARERAPLFNESRWTRALSVQ